MNRNMDYELNNLILKYQLYGDFKKFPYRMRTAEVIKNKLDINNKVLIVSDKLTDIEMFFSALYLREDNNIQSCLYRACLPNLNKFDQIWNIDLDWKKKKYAKLEQLSRGTVINLYQLLSDQGLSLEWNFYNIYNDNLIEDFGKVSDDFRHIDWYGLYYDAKKKYDLEKTELNLENLIFICLELKDFELAFSYMELSDEDKIIGFRKELKHLLKELLTKTEKREGDIVINWIDALDYGSINPENMPYLFERQESSQCFTNAYASAPFTGAAAKAMFAHITMLDDEGYKNKKISLKNSRLIQNCEKNGYIFRYYGMHYKSFVKKYLSTLRQYRTATAGQIHWAMLCDMYEEDKPIMAVAHCMAETHPPFRSCFAGENYVNKESLSYKSINLADCKNSGEKYIDKVLQWYNSFLKNENVMIYLSDHGDPSTLLTAIWRPHVNLFIHKKGLQPFKEKRNFSVINFDAVLMDIIGGHYKSVSDYTVEAAEIQNCDIYNKKRAAAMLTPNNFDYEASIGYHGIATDDALYLLRNDGVEEYYNKFSCINTVSYKCNYEKVKCLREFIIQKNNESKFNGIFPWSDKTYLARRKYLVRIGGRERGTVLLIEKLNTISENKIIAIRGGGIHTVELLNAIGSIGERITYIIDKDISSAKVFKEFKVILPEQVADINIDIVIISSLRYREEFKREVTRYGKKIEIIDVYDMLENEGIFLNKGFYESDYQECDFE